MDFDLTDEQQVVSDLAARLFTDLATPERVREVERSTGFDHHLWQALADAGLLGLCLPGEWGGSGHGAVELALLAEAQGRRVAPVPLVPTVAAAHVLAAHSGDAVRTAVADAVRAGTAVLTAALATPGANDGTAPAVHASPTAGGVQLTGTAPAVPYGREATWVVVPARRSDGSLIGAVVATEAGGIERVDLETTAHQPQVDLVLDHTVSDEWTLPAEAVRRLRQITLAANAAMVVGVADGALAMTAEYVSSRQQFGKPLASFQAVGQRAADAYIAVQAMRATALNAAWRLSAGLDADRDVEVAAFWAAEGGQAATQACQHLHGGIGADIDYPVHRHFLWAIQIANELGSASAHLASIGQLLAAGGSS